MCGGVDEPCGVESEDGAEKDAPEEIGPASKGEECEAENRYREPVPLTDPDVELILSQFGDVREKFGRVVMHGLAGHEPADVGP